MTKLVYSQGYFVITMCSTPYNSTHRHDLMKLGFEVSSTQYGPTHVGEEQFRIPIEHTKDKNGDFKAKVQKLPGEIKIQITSDTKYKGCIGKVIGLSFRNLMEMSKSRSNWSGPFYKNIFHHPYRHNGGLFVKLEFSDGKTEWLHYNAETIMGGLKFMPDDTEITKSTTEYIDGKFVLSYPSYSNPDGTLEDVGFTYSGEGIYDSGSYRVSTNKQYEIDIQFTIETRQGYNYSYRRQEDYDAVKKVKPIAVPGNVKAKVISHGVSKNCVGQVVSLSFRQLGRYYEDKPFVFENGYGSQEHLWLKLKFEDKDVWHKWDNVKIVDENTEITNHVTNEEVKDMYGNKIEIDKIAVYTQYNMTYPGIGFVKKITPSRVTIKDIKGSERSLDPSRCICFNADSITEELAMIMLKG